jgi:hypothetical protein
VTISDRLAFILGQLSEPQLVRLESIAAAWGYGLESPQLTGLGFVSPDGPVAVPADGSIPTGCRPLGPEHWPTAPPIEPGYYWIAWPGHAAEIVEVSSNLWGLCARTFSDSDEYGLADLSEFSTAGWRPGRIEP